jgi:hypothetical protein
MDGVLRVTRLLAQGTQEAQPVGELQQPVAQDKRVQGVLMNTYFPAELSVFANEGEGDQIGDDTMLAAQVINQDKDGLLISYNSGGKRFYLQFKLSELVMAIEDHDK